MTERGRGGIDEPKQYIGSSMEGMMPRRRSKKARVHFGNDLNRRNVASGGES